jgi:hypothetical protein
MTLSIIGLISKLDTWQHFEFENIFALSSEPISANNNFKIKGYCTLSGLRFFIIVSGFVLVVSLGAATDIDVHALPAC